MAIPLKTGADLYNNELLRARLHNHPADALDEYGVGSFYFNNSSGLNSSNRMRYRGLTAWHSVANLEDIEDVKDLIKALSGSSSESVASVLGRVITLEGYFSNGKAKDADLLDGHNSDYFAEAATLNDLLEDYEAFKAVFADNSDDYINTWTEVKNFLDGIKNTEDLNAILLGINTELGKKADKATTLDGYGITDAAKYYGTYSVDSARYGVGYDNMSQGSVDLPVAGGGFIAATQGKYGFQIVGGYSSAGHMFWRRVENDTFGTWRKVLDENNYSNLITALNGNLSVGGNLTASGNSINLGNADSITAVAGTFSVNKSATFKENVFFTSAEGIYINSTSINWGKEFGFVSPLINFAANQITVKQKATIEGDLYVTGHIIADGQVSSGGIGSEGSGSGASGIVILEDWEKYDDTLAQVLGAGLGVGLRDKIAALESKATNVSVAQTLTSGKEIGAITIDGVATKLFAPDDYLPLSGGTLNGSLGMTSAEIPDGAVGLWGTGSLYLKASDKVSFYNSSTGAFNEILHSGNYATTLDNAYLKLTGGMINTGDIAGLTIYRNNSKYSMVHFCNNEEGILVDVGYLGVVGEGVPVYLNSGGNQFNLLHAGNFNSYAPTLTGTGASGTWGIDISGSADSFNLHHASPNKASVDRFFTGGFQSSGTPKTNYATGFTLRNFDLAWDFQLSFDSDARLYTRRRTSSDWQDWKTVAFTDSDITGNAASATKLADNNAYTAWGQKFFENGKPKNVSEDIRLPNYKALQSYTVGGTLRNLVVFNTADNLDIGDANYDTNIIGNKLIFKTGSYKTSMVINSSGNVTIGPSDYAGSDYRLYVNAGRVRFASVAGEAPTLGTMSNMAVAVGLAEYGMQSYVLGNGNAHIQVGRFDGNANAYSLCLNPLGGNVGIGTADPKYKLEVHGTIKHYNNENNLKLYTKISDCNIQVGRTTSAYTGGYNCGLSVGEDDKALTYLAGAYVNGVGTTGIQYFYGGTGAGGAAICISDNIGIVLYKKITTYSRLLVKGATDDGVTALQVNGDIVIPNYTAYKAYDTNGDKMNLMYLDTSNRLKVYNDTMSFTPQGKVGIGTPTPQEKLHVVGNLYVTGNIIADGQVSSGGVAEEGTGGVGGSALDRLVFEIPANTTSFPCEHGLGTRDISVTIYEKGNDFQQVLADVYLDSTNVARIVFGSATDVAHKVVIIG